MVQISPSVTKAYSLLKSQLQVEVDGEICAKVTIFIWGAAALRDNSFRYEFIAQQPEEIDNLVGVWYTQLFSISRVLENCKQDKH